MSTTQRQKKAATGISHGAVPPQLTPWVKGQSGNPRGRAKTDPRTIELREAAKTHTDKALGVLVAALDDPETKYRIQAANAILDRGHGKPVDEVTQREQYQEQFDGKTEDELWDLLREELRQAGKLS